LKRVAPFKAARLRAGDEGWAAGLEAIALAVAQANSCDYCLSAHTALGKRAGLSDAEVASARQGRASDPKTAAIVRFARLLVENRGHATDSELAQLHQAGVTEGEIIEIVANTVLNIFTNYLNHVAGTDIDFPVMRADVAAVA
jgi:AhpD family alkylhydroperoxidase